MRVFPGEDALRGKGGGGGGGSHSTPHQVPFRAIFMSSGTHLGSGGGPMPGHIMGQIDSFITAVIVLNGTPGMGGVQ